MTLGGRFVERRRACLVVDRIDLGAFVQQQFHHAAIAPPGRLVERRSARFIARVHLRAVGQQQRSHFPVAARGRQVQRRLARTVIGLHIRAIGQQQLGYLPVVLDGRIMQRCGTSFQMPRVYIGAVRDQQLGDLPIAVPGRVVQRRRAQPVMRVYIRAGLQQRAHLWRIAGRDRIVQIGRPQRRRPKQQKPTPPGMHRRTPRIALPLRARGRTGAAPCL